MKRPCVCGGRPMIAFKLGELQASAAEIYITDPFWNQGDEDDQPGMVLEDDTLFVPVDRLQEAWQWVTDSANTSDDEAEEARRHHDAEKSQYAVRYRDALTRIAMKISVYAYPR
jgi:hypothetical protein